MGMGSRRKPGFRLYLITDGRQSRGSLYDAVRGALEGGAGAVQLREKDLPVRGLLDMAYEFRKMTDEFGAKLFINGRVDVALAAGADGVHLGGGALPLRAVRKTWGNKLMAGVSTHSVQEALEAEEAGADFVTFGPVFETSSKKKYGPPVGVAALGDAVSNLDIPVFALGGIKDGNVREVMDAGAYGVSMISFVLGAADPRAAAEELMRLLG